MVFDTGLCILACLCFTLNHYVHQPSSSLIKYLNRKPCSVNLEWHNCGLKTWYWKAMTPYQIPNKYQYPTEPI